MLTLSPDVIPFIIALLTACCAGGIVVALLYSRISQNSESQRRFVAIAGAGTSISRQGSTDEAIRKKAIEETLKSLAEKQKVKNGGKPSLKSRMRQAGLMWSASRYYLTCVVCAGIAFVVGAGVFGVGLLPALGFATAFGILLPHLYVNNKRSRRFKNFATEFPNSVDVIVRGVKAGLPLADCLRIISTEAQEPVRSEFRGILEDQSLGIPMDQAVQRLPERIPLAEASFFAIVIALQSSTGGSLSDTLGNLSKVLRERKKMQAKIKAMSSEAKASAGIIGCLPVVVSFFIFLTSPDYISLLFTTTTGKFVLAACAIWMGAGILVMRKMINFDF
jgi:tight adherence protein B